MSDVQIIEENKRRYAALFAEYDPLTGIGSPLDRFPLTFNLQANKPITVFLPLSMKEEPIVKELQKTPDVSELAKVTFGGNIDCVSLFMSVFTTVRFKHDFEFWSFLTLKIQDKITHEDIPFKMRLAQRMLFKVLEEMRLVGVPIRIILLKARQWGGSTLVQMYMLWIQTILKVNWHSAICADIEDQAKNVRGMYHRAASTYPKEVGTITLKPYEKSGKNRVVEERGCIIGIGSMQEPENLRSYNFAMLHLTEVGLWKETQGKKPEDLTQSLRAMLPDTAYTMEVLESTAKGVGNFFHREWLAAKEKRSGYQAVFIPWFKIDLYLKPIENYEAFIKSMTSYDKVQWEQGACLEGIAWYRDFKAKNNYSNWRMMAEFPGSDLEAFSATGSRVFAPEYVQQTRKNCIPPEYMGQVFAKGRKGKDAFVDLEFKQVPNGDLWIWSLPDNSVQVDNRYIIVADVGGRTDVADYSTIRVLDRYWTQFGGPLEAVATYRSHIDQDLFAWICAQVAFLYNRGLLIIEANSLQKEEAESEGFHHLTILNEIAEYYSNIFTRVSPEKAKGDNALIYGFHTSSANKPLVIDSMNGAMRDRTYIEYDSRVMDEADCFELKPNGKMGAVDGAHDDLVMPTAIGIWCHDSPISIGPCREVDKLRNTVNKRVVNESSL